MKKESSINMTQGNVIKVLLAFAVPVFISNLFQQLYNIVDMTVIGHVLGDEALAAVGATSSIYSIVIGFVNGMTTGFCVVLAKYFGADNREDFAVTLSHTTGLAAIVAMVLTVLSMIFLSPMLVILNIPAEIMGLAESYIAIILICIIITFGYNLMSAMLMAIGNSRLPLYALIISSVINVVLDILFVGAFDMGVVGAALATVIAQAISAAFLLIYIVKFCPMLHVSFADFKINSRILSDLITTGLSMALMIVIVNIGTVIMQGCVNTFGTYTITGHVAARKYHDLCLLPLGTICSATATFVSQNHGANKPERIKKGIIASLSLGTAWSLFVLAVTMIAGTEIIIALTGTNNDTVIITSMMYLYRNIPFYIGVNALLVMRNSLQALGGKVLPLVASAMELAAKFAAVFFIVPMTGYIGVCWVEPVTWFACMPVVGVGFYRKYKMYGRV